MQQPLQGSISIPASVLVRGLGEESVLLNLDNECYFGLDDIGTCMWAALTGSPRIEDAFAALLAEYDVEPEQLRNDLAAFVHQLAEAGLVQVVDD